MPSPPAAEAEVRPSAAPPAEAPSAGSTAGVLVLFVALAILHTWPLAARPAHASRIDNGDYNLNLWAVHWVARTLPTAPTRVFDAPIFHPSRLTLAYSEPLFVQSLLVAPLVWLDAPAVLTANVALLAGFALTGWAFALLVRRGTGSWLAGIVGGSLVAFNAHHLMRLPHLQALHLELLPLVALALDRLLVRGGVRHAAALGAAVAVQAAVSLYLFFFTVWAAGCAWLARSPEWRQRGARTLAGWALAAMLAGGLVAAPVLWPYAVLARDHDMVRRASDARHCSAGWADYLYTGSRLHHDWWSGPMRARATDASFPGFLALALVLAAMTAPGRGPRERMWLAIVAGAVFLSVAPNLPGFAWLHAHLPLLGGIRCYSRAGQLALVGVGVLGGYGAARVLRAAGRRGVATAVGVALAAGVNLEALRAPVGFTQYHGIPAIYDTLRDEPYAVVVELPFYGRRAFFANAIYMVHATRHYRPLLNGYSGFAPPDLDDTAAALNSFPSLESLAFLHGRGVTHVVVRRTGMSAAALEAAAASPALRRTAGDEERTIYRLASAGARPVTR